MPHVDDPRSFEEILALVDGVDFDPDRTGLDVGQIRVHAGTETVVLEVRWDWGPDPVADTEFIAHSTIDMRKLVTAYRSGERLSDLEKRAISNRVANASPEPWNAYLESWKQGGPDFIQVSVRDDEADMYLWIGTQLAPSSYFRFVGAARSRIPQLLSMLAST